MKKSVPVGIPKKVAVLICALSLFPVLYGNLLLGFNVDFYAVSIQEDEYLEWSSFWAFLLAGLLYASLAFRPRFVWRQDWFSLGLSLFCFLAALEEISWGQRLFGYQPPEYFLASNFQQEFNLHNIVDSDMRSYLIYLIVFGYGVLLPLVMRLKSLQRSVGSWNLMPPPLAVVPCFLLVGLLWAYYPFWFAAEWLELTLGLCFLFSALGIQFESERGAAAPMAVKAMGGWTLVIVLGIASAALMGSRSHDAENISLANKELEALGRDIAAGRIELICGDHTRLYSLASTRNPNALFEGEFASLAQQGLPETRAYYFLDPWNYAYWVRVICRGESYDDRVTFVYSFGPNQRRDAMDSNNIGDDLIVYPE